MIDIYISMSIAKKVKMYSNHRWYGAYGGGLIGLDYFIPVLPSTTLVIASSLLQPKKCLNFGISFALGSTLGGIFASFLLQNFSEFLLNGIFSGIASSESWINMAASAIGDRPLPEASRGIKLIIFPFKINTKFAYTPNLMPYFSLL